MRCLEGSFASRVEGSCRGRSMQAVQERRIGSATTTIFVELKVFRANVASGTGLTHLQPRCSHAARCWSPPVHWESQWNSTAVLSHSHQRKHSQQRRREDECRRQFAVGTQCWIQTSTLRQYVLGTQVPRSGHEIDRSERLISSRVWTRAFDKECRTSGQRLEWRVSRHEAARQGAHTAW